MSIPTAQRLAALYIISSLLTICRAQSPAEDILFHMASKRSTTCPANTNSCQSVDSSLPDNFCCASSSHCISLDSSSSALCCPSGGNCEVIRPSSCDVSKQNATNNPSGFIFTTKLGSSLPTCGSLCCPFGYTCSNGNSCVIDLQTAIGVNNTQATSSASTSTSSATSTTTAASSATSSSSSQNSTTPVTKSSSFSGGSFAAGFFPGILIGAVLTLAWVLFTGRHKHPSSRMSTHSSISYNPHKPVISAPILLDAQTPSSGRTDFLRRTTSRARSIFSHYNPQTAAVDQDWQTVKMPTPPKHNNIPPQSYGLVTVPITPERRVARHEPSTESIRVYSPPSMIHPPIPSAIAPLRGMASQRNLSSQPIEAAGGIGSPFTSPSYNTTAQNPNINRDTSISPPTPIDADRQETLSPARYNNSAARDKGKNKILAQGIAEGIRNQQAPVPGKGSEAGTGTRPTTTFTDMLHQINFPDPMKGGNGNGTPRMPPVPKGYGGSGGGRYA